MYRSPRFPEASRSNRGVVAFTVSAAIVLAAAFACSVRGDKKGHDTTTVAAVSPAVVSQPSAAGEVTDSKPVVPQNVTYASAESAYTQKNYRQAVESFSVYVERRPDNPWGHYMLGLSAWKAGDLERARTSLERALELDPRSVKTLLNLGRVLLEQDRAADAQVRVGAAIEIDTTSAEAHRMMGRVETALGKPDSAMGYYHVALSLDPSDAWSMNNLGLVLIEQGRYEEALPPLARAVELKPDVPVFSNNLGTALERTGHLVAAAEAYRGALAADSTYAKAAKSLARVDGKTDGASITPVDLGALAASFDQEIQSSRQLRAATVKPDSLRPPEK